MNPWLHQTLQSVGQWVLVFLLGMAIFKDWKEVVAMGIANAVWQPALQATITVLGNYGLAKSIPPAAPRPETPKP
jgi:hypothetical protein